MIALIQRVVEASVRVEGEVTGRIGAGLLALIGVERNDHEGNAMRLLERVLTYRVFGDDAGRMNLSLLDTGGGLLLVPQFTLAADTRKGTRASFSCAAAPERARELFDHLVAHARTRCADVQTGVFGADMAVASINHGPVTFRLDA